MNRAYSAFAQLPVAKKDAIFGIHSLYLNDKDSKKVDLTLGAYRDAQGESYVFPVVQKAQAKIVDSSCKMDYNPILGNPSFISQATTFAYGKDLKKSEFDKIAAAQTLSGTGALSLGFALLRKFYGDKDTKIYMSKPTYANHENIIRNAGFSNFKEYSYYNRKSNTLMFNQMVEDLQAAEDRSIVVLQAVAHNPTGTDPTNDQWKELAQIFKEKRLLAVFDCAYQGFATGDPDADAFSFRTFHSAGVDLLLCQSFAKNFGMYGHRVGCLSIPAKSPAQKKALESQLKTIARATYSNPPIHGARMVNSVLTTPSYRREWELQLAKVVERMSEMRRLLREELKKGGSEIDWSHLTEQKGMFCFTGMDANQMQFLREEWHVYGMDNGRISVSGLTKDNVKYVASAIHAASR